MATIKFKTTAGQWKMKISKSGIEIREIYPLGEGALPMPPQKGNKLMIGKNGELVLEDAEKKKLHFGRIEKM